MFLMRVGRGIHERGRFRWKRLKRIRPKIISDILTKKSDERDLKSEFKFYFGPY